MVLLLVLRILICAAAAPTAPVFAAVTAASAAVLDMHQKQSSMHTIVHLDMKRDINKKNKIQMISVDALNTTQHYGTKTNQQELHNVHAVGPDRWIFIKKFVCIEQRTSWPLVSRRLDLSTCHPRAYNYFVCYWYQLISLLTSDFIGAFKLLSSDGNFTSALTKITW